MNVKEKIKLQIHEIDEQLIVWEKKISTANSEAIAEYKKDLIVLKTKRDEIKEKFNELAEATEDKWKETQNFFASASITFKEEFAKFKSLFE